MKLSLEIDLEPIRAEVLRRIDAHFHTRSEAVSPVPVLHAAKLSAALAHLQGRVCQALVEEAATRGMEPDDLARLVLERAKAAHLALRDLDRLRMKLRASALACTSETDLRAVLAQI